MPAVGIQESVSFRLQEIEDEPTPPAVFLTGARDHGSSSAFGLIMYTSIPGVVEPNIYTARPRSKHDSRRRLTRFTMKPKNVLPRSRDRPENSPCSHGASFDVELELWQETRLLSMSENA